MFGEDRKARSGSGKVDTIIGQQTKIDGNITINGGLHIDGAIRGNIVAEPGSDSVLTVSEHGSIDGDVHVQTVILNGSVSGDIHSEERIELAARAKVNGDVHYNMIEMAMGAEVNGNLVRHLEKETSVVSFGRDGSADSAGMPE